MLIALFANGRCLRIMCSVDKKLYVVLFFGGAIYVTSWSRTECMCSTQSRFLPAGSSSVMVYNKTVSKDHAVNSGVEIK